MTDVRTVFMGSPDFALTILRKLIPEVNVIGVVTQPDRPAGRGKGLTSPPVKLFALQQGIPVMQPERLRQPEAFAQIQSWQPELIVVAAFGQILRQSVLDLPRFGCLNVHASLLPRWRGAAPIQAAILNGDEETGVTIMRMDAGVDTGDILAQRAITIEDEDDSETLTVKLADIGAQLLVDILPDYLRGAIIPIKQNHELATYAPMLKKEDGYLDFSLPAAVLARRVRAFQPWPGAYMIWEGQPLKIRQAISFDYSGLFPGQCGILQRYPAVGTSVGVLVLKEVQPAGRKPMPGKVFLNGARNWAGSIAGSAKLIYD